MDQKKVFSWGGGAPCRGIIPGKKFHKPNPTPKLPPLSEKRFLKSTHPINNDKETAEAILRVARKMAEKTF